LIPITFGGLTEIFLDLPTNKNGNRVTWPLRIHRRHIRGHAHRALFASKLIVNIQERCIGAIGSPALRWVAPAPQHY
jgi:hypothetical protein